MEKIITINNLRNFAYCNNQICIKPIKGMVVSFFGLGGATIFNEDTEEGCRYAEKGILYLVPYQNPWAWMNKQTVDYTDELIDVLFKEYNLPGICLFIPQVEVWGDCRHWYIQLTQNAHRLLV